MWSLSSFYEDIEFASFSLGTPREPGEPRQNLASEGPGDSMAARGEVVCCSRPFPPKSNNDWSRAWRAADPGTSSGRLLRHLGQCERSRRSGRFRWIKGPGEGQVGAGRQREQRRRGQDERGGGGPGGGHLQPALHPAADLLVRVPAGGVAAREASAQSLPG